MELSKHLKKERSFVSLDGKQVPLIEEEEALRKNGVCRVEIPFSEEERKYWSKVSCCFQNLIYFLKGVEHSFSLILFLSPCLSFICIRP
jgi:hypothetical protein